jgi:hypothetical protein
MSVIPALGKLRQENCKFEASLGFIVRACLKKQNKAKQKTVMHGGPYL